MEMLKERDVKFSSYRFADGFVMDIEESPTMFEMWVYHEEYGVKIHVFGVEKCEMNRAEFIKHTLCGDVLDKTMTAYRKRFMERS